MSEGQISKADELIAFVLSSFEGITLMYHLGEKGLFYNPGKKLQKGAYFITVKEDSGDGYRLSLAVSRQTFHGLFGCYPSEIAEQGLFFGDEEDAIVPHPEFAHSGWITVRSPGEKSLKRLRPLLKDAYELAKEKFSQAWKKKTTSVLRRP
jgi:hypothetical protein